MRAPALLGFVALVLFAAQPASAHGFHLELTVKGGKVHGEAFFGDGEPPGEATWTAFRAEARLASGKLDPKGHFDWTAPAPGTYRFEVKEVGLHVASAEVVVKATPTPAPTQSAAAPPDQARRPRRGRGGGRSRVKRLLTGLGGIALLGVGLYRFQRRRRESESEDTGTEGDA